MIRRLFTFLSILSLLLFLLFAVFWIRSWMRLAPALGNATYGHTGEAVYQIHFLTDRSPNWYMLRGIGSYKGNLILVRYYGECSTPEKVSQGLYSTYGNLVMDRGDRPAQSFPTIYVWENSINHTYDLGGTLLRRLGFAVFKIGPGTHSSSWEREVYIPYWFITLLFAFLPALNQCRRFLRRRRTAQRRAAGLCLTCAYDLRAHLEGNAGNKCPECGTPITR